MNCPDPRIVPPGFVYIFPKGYAEDANGNWRCAPGYAGKIFFNCTFKDGANCTMVKEPAGCLPLAMCSPPELGGEESGNCTWDVSTCDIMAGVDCLVRCREPFMGISGLAHCPDNNTDP
eukprot:CAMPEP_0115157874 /NCGR_PEP_ID=MMETSP0227-20121206/69264_1 /TAXON_ID=89957 /ORGANISM="Polarella glacialis, Strain CCMP 1383" /LENGTH=118 /DNA_ID=CAMNT_0002569253 /DNA_START=219 /DNA_END=572 /DNA_ORIENTATION=+